MKLKFEKLPHQTKAVENILSVFKDCLFNEPGKEPDSKTEMGLHTRTNPRLNFETSNRAKLQDKIFSTAFVWWGSFSNLSFILLLFWWLKQFWFFCF